MVNPGTFDHVAIEVAAFDERVEWMTTHLGFELRRVGHLRSDPDRRIAMLADRRGVKLELVEGPAGTVADRLLHVALAVDDVDATVAALTDAGADEVRAPHRFEPARSRTAEVQPPDGFPIQLVRYDDDSPDR